MSPLESEILHLKFELEKVKNDFNLILELNKQLMAENKILKKENIELKEENVKLKLELEKLKVKPNEPSGSKPDYLKENKKKTKTKSGRKKGHKGISRNNPKDIDKEQHYHARDTCHECGSSDLRAAKARKKYVTDLIFQLVHILEFYHDKICNICGAKIKAISPNGDSQSPYGKNLKSLFIYLRNKCGVTLRPAEVLFTDYFGVPITDSSISNNEINLSKLSELKYNSYLEEIKKSQFSHKDETSYRVGGKTYWIWVYDNLMRVFYRLSDNRGKRTLIKDFGQNPDHGSINDCYEAYNLFKLIQICWAHILRECKFHAEKKNATKDEKVFYKKIKELFKLAKKRRLEEKSLEKRKQMRKEFELKLITILISTKKETDFLRRMCNRLDKQMENTFLLCDWHVQCLADASSAMGLKRGNI